MRKRTHVSTKDGSIEATWEVRQAKGRPTMRSPTPTLDKTTRCMGCVGLPKPCTICAKRLREFRALKAVARAAERDGSPDCLCDTCKAVARLKRLGEQSKKGGARS